MRTKNVELVALGFVTLLKDTVVVPVGAAELPDLLSRRLPAVDVFTVQPEASPKLVGWPVSVEELLEKPEGVVQVPLAVVHTSKDADCKTVEDGNTKLKP